MKVTVEQKTAPVDFRSLPVGATFVNGAILAACSEVYVKRNYSVIDNTLKLSNGEIITVNDNTSCTVVQITEIKTRVL